MNFSEMKIIWNAQESQNLFAFDHDALRKIIETDSRAAARDLGYIEISAIVMLCFLGTMALIDTFFNGQEYFQLIGVTVDFVAAAWLFWRRRRREGSLTDKPATLLGIVDASITRVQAAISRARDLAICFAMFAAYGVAIRIFIYGWQGSEAKFVITIVGSILVFVAVAASEKSTHRPRLTNFESLRDKLQNFTNESDTPANT